MMSLLRSSGLLLLPITAAVAIAACGTTATATPDAPPSPVPLAVVDSASARAELLWDDYGVPHIFAKDPAALFYAFGWAQMRSHGDLILRLYGQSRARAAEYWGEGFVDSDLWVLTNGVPTRAERWLAAQPAHIRAYIDAFVGGMNAYATHHAGAIGAAWKVVLPIQPVDVLAHMNRVVHFGFIANPLMVTAARRHLQLPGSNGWAINRARSASGNPLLLINPHLPWADYFTWYEAHLSLPDVNAYGATFVGMPFIGLGFNEQLGWTHTVNTIDNADLYDIETRDDGYLYDGAVRAFERDEHVLRVRMQDNTIAERRVTVKRTEHGPVIAEREGRVVALRVAGLDAPHLFHQYWEMARATNRAEFELAISLLQMPLFTVLYADRHGDIMHVFNGRVPVRNSGDFNYWSGIVPGSTSATMWTETHPYHDLPRVVNPSSGWLQNANDPPWTTTLPYPLEPMRFPAYVAPMRPLAFRPQRSVRMLHEDERISFDEMIAYKHSTRIEAADHLVQDVVAAARAGGDEDGRQAAEVLERWDRTADADSRGAVLFAELYAQLRRQRWPNNSMFEIPWDPRLPLVTPDGLSDPRLAAQALGLAARRVRALHGSLDVAWGDVHRFRRDSVDLPANGGTGVLGIFRVIDFDAVPGDSTRFVATGGDGFVAAVEFSSPIRARSLLAYGNASQPGSPHRTDQIGLMARKEMRSVLFTREAVLAVVRLREYF